MHIRIEHRLFDTLFETEYRGVLALGRRVAGPSVAEDVAQEAFAALLRARIDDPAHARHWLYRTALHRALDAVRRDRSRRDREIAAAAVDVPPQPSELIERSEAAASLRRALAKLKPSYAAALSLRASGFSYKDIAAMLDVPADRIGVMLMRAEAALKKEIPDVTTSR
ncbi:MAG TPA: sigma-70 family RNA polymerase sigma factor [Candidatus Aquilonibacter sp.]|nr:sigma-70 family RNA polymerase sigma factor [Candidatus Aquilonibacter sp.]